jgi:nitrogen fixation NifU-like protein
MPRPSDPVLQRVACPRFTGALPSRSDRVGTGIAMADSCGDVIQVQVQIGSDVSIAAARHKTYGCGQAIGAAEMVCELVEGRTVAEARLLDAETVARKLKTTDLHAVRVAVSALLLALDATSGQ